MLTEDGGIPIASIGIGSRGGFGIEVRRARLRSLVVSSISLSRWTRFG
jgi:hypothetical protein